MRLRWAVVLLAVLATGCYRVTYVAPHVMPGAVHDESPSFFFWGLVGEAHYDLSSFCPGQVARVRTGMNVLDGLLTLITLGIYSPRTVSVTCALGQGSLPAEPRAFELSLDDAGEPVRVVEARGDTLRVGQVLPAGPGRWKVSFEREALR